jgi:hypothetical protein
MKVIDRVLSHIGGEKEELLAWLQEAWPVSADFVATMGCYPDDSGPIETFAEAGLTEAERKHIGETDDNAAVCVAERRAYALGLAVGLRLARALED